MSAFALHRAGQLRPAKEKLPAPLVTLRHPLKFVKQKTITLIDLLIFIHIGTLIIVGLYYLSFETIPWVTARWHEIGPEVFGTTAKDWSYVRHLIRDVGEGLLGGYLGQMIVWNHFKPRVRKLQAKSLSKLDRFEIKLHVPNLKNKARLTAGQYLASPLLGIVYAIPGFALAVLAVKWAHIHAPAEAATASYGAKVEAIFTGNYDKKIVGLFASLVIGRRPMKKVYDDVQLYFAERRVLLGKSLRWYHPPTFQARYNSIASDLLDREVLGVEDAKRAYHTGRLNTVMTAALIVGVALAGFGYYVLTVIA